MKRFPIFLCATLLVLGCVGSAGALTIGYSYDVSLLDQDLGLVLHWAPILDTSGELTLEVCEPQEVKLFSLWTDESAINSDDIVHYPIEVEFNLFPGLTGKVLGETYGWTEWAWFLQLQGGAVTWAEPPPILDFGYLGTGKLEVDLHDATFNVGLYGTLPGQCLGADISGTFHVTQAPTPVPEPAGILLLGTGLVGLSGLRKKFKR